MCPHREKTHRERPRRDGDERCAPPLTMSLVTVPRMFVHRDGPRGARGGARGGAIVLILALGPTFVTPRLPPHVPHVAHSVLYA